MRLYLSLVLATLVASAFTQEVPDEIVEVEEPRKPTKKELKAVDKFNAAVDNIANILSERLSGENDTLPLDVDEEVLEELEVEVTTLPPPTTTEATPAEPECPDKWVDKCLGDKCKGKANCLKKCEKKGCATEKKNKKKNKNNKNKKNKRKGDENKNNKKKKKNKNKNNNISSQLFKTRGGSNRQSKDLDFDDLDDEDELEQGRRMGENKKNKRKNNRDRSGLMPEARDKYVPKSAETGPMFASDDELIASSAQMMGFSHIRREGDVKVDMSGKHTKFVATVVLGPLNVIPTSPARMLRRSEVTTELRATMHFTAKEARRRNKLSINEVVVEVVEPKNVSVMRSDLLLEPEVITAAQDEVSSAIDVDRVARILQATLAAAFDEDNIMQNIEDHPALKA